MTFEKGTKVAKNFPDNGGWFKGVVERGPSGEGYYRVRYSDGDRDENDEREIRAMIRNFEREFGDGKRTAAEKTKRSATSSRKPSNRVSKRGATFSLRTRGKKEEDEQQEETEGAEDEQVFELGTKIAKRFGKHGWFEGTVIAFDPNDGANLYKVEYSDGDTDENTEREIRKGIRFHKEGKHNMGKRLSPEQAVPLGTPIAKLVNYSEWFRGMVEHFDGGIYQLRFGNKVESTNDESDVIQMMEDRMRIDDEEKQARQNKKKQKASSKGAKKNAAGNEPSGANDDATNEGGTRRSPRRLASKAVAEKGTPRSLESNHARTVKSMEELLDLSVAEDKTKKRDRLTEEDQGDDDDAAATLEQKSLSSSKKRTKRTIASRKDEDAAEDDKKQNVKNDNDGDAVMGKEDEGGTTIAADSEGATAAADKGESNGDASPSAADHLEEKQGSTDEAKPRTEEGEPKVAKDVNGNGGDSAMKEEGSAGDRKSEETSGNDGKQSGGGETSK